MFILLYPPCGGLNLTFNPQTAKITCSDQYSLLRTTGDMSRPTVVICLSVSLAETPHGCVRPLTSARR